jgi:TPR repeat protein
VPDAPNPTSVTTPHISHNADITPAKKNKNETNKRETGTPCPSPLLAVSAQAFLLASRRADEATTQFEATKAKAETGDAQAQCNLGDCYLLGRGVAGDDVEAVKWYRQAAEQNDASAQESLGDCYFLGQGVAKDDVEAVRWYRQAAEQNDASAQESLGNCYVDGRGVARDDVEAVKWYRQAAEQNDASAQLMLGNCYEYGVGVAKDYVQAYKWYNLAAARGETGAIYKRDSIAGSMTPNQIAEGQRLSAINRTAAAEKAKHSKDNAASP